MKKNFFSFYNSGGSVLNPEPRYPEPFIINKFKKVFKDAIILNIVDKFQSGQMGNA